MNATEYFHDGHSWSPCPTEDDAHSFFHAAFGVRDQDGSLYKDKRAIFRRRWWLTLLVHFKKTTTRPSCLLDVLEETRPPGNDTTIAYKYQEYFDDVSQPKYEIKMEDIRILAAAENIKVTVFTDQNKDPPIILEPNEELIRLYPIKRKRNLREAVIYFDGSRFKRMYRRNVRSAQTPASASVVNAIPDNAAPTKYKKLQGTAGIKGILYQINLLTIFLLNGLKRSPESWRLSTEKEDAGKFDDLVFERVTAENEVLGQILLQAKSRKEKSYTIKYDELFFTPKCDKFGNYRKGKDDFSLPKYFASYMEIKSKFTKIQNLIICTNVNLHKDVIGTKKVDKKVLDKDHMLHYEGDGSICYKFNPTIISDLEKAIAKYFGNTSEVRYTVEDIKDFLERLQFIANYPSQSDLDQVIAYILSGMKLCDHFESKDFAKYIIKKMIEWYEEERTGKKGNNIRYMTEVDARALFSEIRSNKFCEKLRNCGISISNVKVFETKGLPKISCVISENGYVLNMIKIYAEFADLHGKNEMLFVNPRDDIQIRKQIIEAFFDAPRYKLLVASPTVVEITYIHDKLPVLRPYKKVILIGKKADLASILEDNFQKKNPNNITINQLDPDSKETVIKKMIQFYRTKM